MKQRKKPQDLVVSDLTVSTHARNDSIESTIAVPDGLSKEHTQAPLSCNSNRERVCFIADHENKLYESMYDSKDDIRQRWYTRDEMAQFRRVALDKTDSITGSSRQDPAHLKWFLGLLEACMRLKNEAITQAFIDRVVHICRISLDDPDLVGLEKFLLRPIFDKDRSTRKQIMMDRICYSSPRLVRFHGQTSREASRPDRLLAYLIARMHAEALKK
eukprot:scaffold6814_cov151-Amphora_coffeaeformis.AAC.2